METATCIAKSSMLVSRRQTIHTFKPVNDRTEAHLELNAFRRRNDSCLIITGQSLEVGSLQRGQYIYRCVRVYVYQLFRQHM